MAIKATLLTAHGKDFEFAVAFVDLRKVDCAVGGAAYCVLALTANTALVHICGGRNAFIIEREGLEKQVAFAVNLDLYACRVGHLVRLVGHMYHSLRFYHRTFQLQHAPRR